MGSIVLGSTNRGLVAVTHFGPAPQGATDEHFAKWPIRSAFTTVQGVGIGTVYCNLATREELVATVYRAELARLCARVEGLLEKLSQDAALRSWMASYWTGAEDVSASLAGIFIATGAADQREQAGRMLDLLAAGIQAR